MIREVASFQQLSLKQRSGGRQGEGSVCCPAKFRLGSELRNWLEILIEGARKVARVGGALLSLACR